MKFRLRTAGMIALATSLVATPQLLSARSEPAAAAVPVDQSYPVPASGRFEVHGHGYGHGNGMSQHGAQGAALEGPQHEEILGFYYPGTSLGRARRNIRVLITSDTTSDVVVAARRTLAVRDLGADVTSTLPRDLGATRWRLEVNRRNRNVVDYFADGSWRPWRPGGKRALVGEGEFRADRPIKLSTPSGRYRFRGRLRAVAPDAGSTSRDTVNVVKLDDYVKGVVPYEMPALWEPEAVQAQSVAARTYGVWSRAENRDRYYHICDTTACQVYRGVDGEHPASNRATKATTRQILTYDGRPAFAQFSASSGGWTSAGNAPYLKAKRDPYDDWSGNSNHDWSVALAASTIERAYPSIGRLRRIRITARDGNGQWNGRVITMSLIGSRGTAGLSGDDFRFRFGLRSTWFSF